MNEAAIKDYIALRMVESLLLQARNILTTASLYTEDLSTGQDNGEIDRPIDSAQEAIDVALLTIDVRLGRE